MSPAEREQLERDRMLLGRKCFTQCFQPYLRRETMPRFITSDSLLNGFHVLLEESVKQLEEVNVARLGQGLKLLWAQLEPSREHPLAWQRARWILGVALGLLGESLEPDEQIQVEVARVEEAVQEFLPDWLAPPTPALQTLDYRRFRVRGFYTKTAPLSAYFRATAWLQSIPLRMEREDEVVTAWLLCRAGGPKLATIQQPLRRLARAGDWDMSLFSGRESLTEFQDKLRKLPPPPCLNDQVGIGLGPNLRVLSGLALPDSLFFHRRDPYALPETRALCAALGSSLASGESGREELSLKGGEHLFDAYLGVLARLFEEPPAQAPDFMRGQPWRRKSCQTVLSAWAQMRHTWALQAKECYVILCLEDHPKPIGFVEPVPRFYRALGDLVARFLDTLGCEPDRHDWARQLRVLAEEMGRRMESGDFEEYECRETCEHLIKLNLQEAHELENNPRVDLLGPAFTLGQALLKPCWGRMVKLCHQLACIADKQLAGEALDEGDQEIILSYGEELASIMLYQGDSRDSPEDDAPRIAEVGVEKGRRMQVGVGRPRELYVLYPTQDGDVLCRGAVLPYAEFISSEPVTDEEWREQIRAKANFPTPGWLQGD